MSDKYGKKSPPVKTPQTDEEIRRQREAMLGRPLKDTEVPPKQD